MFYLISNFSIFINTTFTILSGEHVVDYFTVDYQEKDQEKLSKNILKRISYGSSNVKFVDVVNGKMQVTCELMNLKGEAIHLL